MSVTIQAYEDWGPAIGSPLAGTTRTLITNANLKTFSDPAQHYYLNDVARPRGLYLEHPNHMCSYTRYIAFKMTVGTRRVRNVKIEIPQGFLSDKWRVMYKLTNIYSEPLGVMNEFSKMSGVMDGSLNTLTSAVTLHPRLSSSGPQNATTRPVTSAASQTIWTEYLVLQFMAHPSDFDDVDNFGTETISLTLEELEI